MRNVWSKGDLCFRSGDILVTYLYAPIINYLFIMQSTHVKNLFLDKQVSDELGYLYFKDRKGDTFR